MIWINFLPFRWQSNYDDDDDDDGQGKKTSRRQIFSFFISFHLQIFEKFLAFIKHSNQYSIMIIILLFFGFFKKQQRKNQWHNLTSTSFGLIFGFPQYVLVIQFFVFFWFCWWIFHQLLINCQKKKRTKMKMFTNLLCWLWNQSNIWMMSIHNSTFVIDKWEYSFIIHSFILVIVPKVYNTSIINNNKEHIAVVVVKLLHSLVVCFSFLLINYWFSV